MTAFAELLESHPMAPSVCANLAVGDAWAPVRLPTASEQVDAYWRRIRREHVEPAVRAKSSGEFAGALFRALLPFSRAAITLTELFGDDDRPDRTHLQGQVELAAEFGGDAWAESVRTSLRYATRTSEVSKRLRASGWPRTRADEKTAALAGVATLIWSFSWACYVAMLDGVEAEPEVREVVRALLIEAPEAAVVHLRGVELGRMDKRKLPDVGDLDDEAVELEVAAALMAREAQG